ncbi:DUF484 family protein [uncultured Jannaschia sp.]|uniref:DUF484 family protein n=1 Tax=uncultured Jannaschia sp. TaxID=293347 RepID=UPI00261A755D|nr:DUF484 family protein [uncultured Jannaschia sp.]
MAENTILARDAENGARAQGRDWRDSVLTDPELVLEDRDVMRALIAADAERMGGNVVDLRGIAMQRLEARLDRLEDTHRSVIAAAYENLAGTNQIHRCVLAVLEAETLPELLDHLTGQIADIVRVDRVRLALESQAPGATPHPAIAPVATGFVDDYVTRGREGPVRQVTLRRCTPAAREIYGPDAGRIRSEALLRLDLGTGRQRGLLAFGVEDATQFGPGQGTELLSFFTAAFERVLRRHLAQA